MYRKGEKTVLKLLIEKDKTKISDELPIFIENKITQCHIKKSEDKKYILLCISLPCTVKKHKRRKNAKLVQSIVNIIVQYIILNITKRFVKETISSLRFIYGNEINTDKICGMICNDIVNKIRFEMRRKKYENWYFTLFNRILKNMLESGIFAVNAFIRFRMDDYKGFVHEFTLSAIERCHRENKYMEFIESLQYFVDSRTSRLKEIVINTDSNEYTLTDGNGMPIDISVYEQLLNEDTNKEDLLMGILLTVAPQKIILNADEGFYDSDFFSSLSNIFGNRLQTNYFSQ